MSGSPRSRPPASRAAGRTAGGRRARRTAVVIHADGACRGNPGPAGAGVVVAAPGGEVIEELARYLGHGTNNIAEYLALILGLEAAKRHGAVEVTVRMDSELVVRQVGGSYKVKNAKLKELHSRATDLVRGFRRFTIEHVPRSANAEADRLANQALDTALDRSVLGDALDGTEGTA